MASILLVAECLLTVKQSGITSIEIILNKKVIYVLYDKKGKWSSMRRNGYKLNRRVRSLAFLLILGILLTACAATDSTLETEIETVTEKENQSTEIEIEPEVATETVMESETMDEDIFKDSGIKTFELSSEELQGGVWDAVITNTPEGLNVSPQLTWETVTEAESYVIYMVDTSAGDWIHWKTNNVTETSIPQGWAPVTEYIGPYPPPGTTHNYEIYVIALKQSVERAKGALNTSNPRFVEHVMALDETEVGTSGNILGYGRITGAYTAK